MTIEKLLYLLTPPFIVKIIQKLTPKNKKRALNTSQNNKNGEIELKKLKTMKFNYFMEGEVIEEFCDQMLLHNQSTRAVEPTDQNNLKYLQELDENGICKISGLIDLKIIESLHNEVLNCVLPLQEKMESLIFKNGNKSGKNILETYNGRQVNFELNNAVIRLWDIQKNNKLIKKEFLKNIIINDICKSYLGGKMNESRVYAEYKYKKLLIDPNMRAHVDSPFKIIKVFLLLNDISIDNAPFSYYKKSHTFNQWRILKDLLEFSQVDKKYFSHYANYSDIELSKILREYPESISGRIDMTGKAGDVIITDNRGVHQGNILYDGYRLQLCLAYGPLGDFDIGNIPKHITNLVKNSK
jgi:hypothetical protein